MALDDGRARRISFAYTHAGQPRRDPGPNYVGSFSVPFQETIGPIFEKETCIELSRGQFGNFWCRIRTEEEFARIEDWVHQQGTRIFLRDCLDLSIALDLNFPEPGASHTALGERENRAKHRRDEKAIRYLAEALVRAIRDLSFYRDCRFIAAVPAPPDKGFHLPNILVARVAAALGLTDLTNGFSFSGTKRSIKNLPMNEKWTAWENSGLAFDTPPPVDYDGSPVILIDDKYQSGTTIQFVAARMRAAGIGRIYGLCVVKTLRDTDNT